jgi:hypothetical protein
MDRKLTIDQLQTHTLLTDLIDPQKLDFIKEYVRQQSRLVVPFEIPLPPPENHPKRTVKRKSNVVANMRRKGPAKEGPKSPLSTSNQPKKKVKRLTIKNTQGIFNKGVRSTRQRMLLLL